MEAIVVAKEESDRCWKVATETHNNATALVAVKQRLGKSLKAETTNIVDELKDVSKLLRDCTDLILIFRGRWRMAEEYFNIILPSINHTNRLLYHHLGDTDLLYDKTTENKLNAIFMKMHNDVDISLLHRFTIYKCFLTELVHLLQK